MDKEKIIEGVGIVIDALVFVSVVVTIVLVALIVSLKFTKGIG